MTCFRVQIVPSVIGNNKCICHASFFLDAAPGARTIVLDLAAGARGLRPIGYLTGP